MELHESASRTSTLMQLFLVASIAAGVQFAWALQLSLLTPYIILLGVPHAWVSIVWLCAPISGLLVQPIVGHYSDRCKSRFGRRTPFIAGGVALVAISILFIGYAADIGVHFGDSSQKPTKPRAVAIFLVGFSILDVAFNILQGPCRALLADICFFDINKMRAANSFYAFFTAVGNVLGYAAGSYTNLHKLFPFTLSKSCDVYCANFKSCIFISVILLLMFTIFALVHVREVPPTTSDYLESTTSTTVPFFAQLSSAIKEIKRPMWMLLLTNCFNWIAWSPFVMYNTDWMGREVYGGKAGGDLYDMGVRDGALGLMICSLVLGFMSIAILFLTQGTGRKLNRLWGIVNFVLAFGLIMTVFVTMSAESSRQKAAAKKSVFGPSSPQPPSRAIKGGALAIFAVLGLPLAVTYSIPFTIASTISSTCGAGQGLSLGVLNMSILMPQVIMSLTTGPLDAAFGGSNLPGFVFGAAAAVVSGVLAITMLPSTS